VIGCGADTASHLITKALPRNVPHKLALLFSGTLLSDKVAYSAL